MDDRPIGIFDSGVGGLSILQEVRKLLPNESIVYFGDQANVPYGAKDPDEIKRISKNAVEFLLKQNVKAIIIACNSATVHALDYLRSSFDTPMVGVTPVVKTLVQKTKSGKIAVFSTPATAKSQYLSDLVKKFADGKKVFVVGDTGLELLVEKGELNGKNVEQNLKKFFSPLLAEGVDAVALGCTHYPFLKDSFKAMAGKNVGIYDSGAAIARQMKRVLKNNKSLSSNKKPDYTFFTSGNLVNFKKIAEKLLSEKLEDVRQAGI